MDENLNENVNTTEQNEVDKTLDATLEADSEEKAEAEDALIAQGEKEPDKENGKKTKKASKAKAIVLCLVGFFAVLIIAVGSFAYIDYSGMLLKKEVELQIPKGSSAAQTAEILKDNGVIKSPLIFRVYSRIKGYDVQFKYGNYKFLPKMGYSAVCDKLMYEGAIAPSKTVTIPEGTPLSDYTKNVNGEDKTIPGIASILENAGVCTKADFFEALGNVKLEGELLASVNTENAYLPLEGYLYPNTYEFYYYDSKECAALAIQKMLDQANSVFTREMYDRAQELKLSVNEVLTLASIVQMESGINVSAMPDVAAVFYNRMKRGEALGSSPTIYYGDAFKEDDGRYNTQAEIGRFPAIVGLPPSAICSPGIEAIKAVLYPSENSPYYYFVTDKNGKFYFHKTFNEQEETISRLKREGNWINEYY